jgi:hypothetical protein
MGGRGSGMGMRFNTQRTKAFVQERKSISARMFTFKTMQKIPLQGISIVLHGVNILVTSTHMEIGRASGVVMRTLRIPLAQSKANYGNTRFWMTCPHQQCQRRCEKLYLCKLPDGVPLFLCRMCLNLAYSSQNQTFLDRMIDKKWAIIGRLKSESEFICNKPKRMHWKTFCRLKEEVEILDREIMRLWHSKFHGLKGCEKSALDCFRV